MRLKHYIKLTFFFILLIKCLYALSPVVTNVSPYFGPDSGSTNVTLTGSGFSNATAVYFGSEPGIMINVLDDQTIMVQSPPHVPQVISITVVVGNETSSITPNSYFVYQGNLRAYIISSNPSTISVLDTSNNTIIKVLDIGDPNIAINFTTAVSTTPDATQVYVITDNEASLAAIDAANLSFSKIFDNTSKIFASLSITPNGTKVYITDSISNQTIVIDSANNNVLSTIDVEYSPFGIAITPNSQKAYVINQGDIEDKKIEANGSFSVIDTQTETVSSNIPTSEVNGLDVVITPDGNKAYVTNPMYDIVTVINTINDTISSTISSISNPNVIIIPSNGLYAYVLTNDNNIAYVTVINIMNDTVIANINIGALNSFSVGDLVTNLQGTQVYALNSQLKTVTVINTDNNEIARTINFTENIISLDITPDGQTLYVAPEGFSMIFAVNTNTYEQQTITTNIPFSITINPDQSPLAKFTYALSLAGQSSNFDASDSISPIGTIANYYWDFGDGNQINTSNPNISHSYVTPGNYNISLTVTNSSGTSSKQVYTPKSNNTLDNILGDEILFSIIKNITHNGGLTAIATAQIIIFAPPPTINNVNPSLGLSCQTTQVTITGTNFTGATNVLFGTAPAVSFTVNSDTSITAIAPVANPGTVNITVMTPGGTSAITSADQFTYVVCPPAITTVSPSSGLSCQTTQVTITGTNFTGATNVSFGTAPAVSFTVNSDTSITAIAPVANPGIVNITVMTPGGTSAITPADQFTYIMCPPAITTVSPSSGLSCQTTQVTITGTNFTGATNVLFGAVSAVSFTVNSDTSITAIAPAANPNIVNIIVTTPEGTSNLVVNDQFMYIFPPPRKLQGKQLKNRFVTQTDIVNVLTWKAPKMTCPIISYRIYRDSSLTQLIATIPTNHDLYFEDHQRKKGHSYTYFIVAVDQIGMLSQFASIVIKPR